MKHPQHKPQSSFDVDRFIEEAATAAADKPPPKRRGRKEASPNPRPASKAKPEAAMTQEAVVEDSESTGSEPPRAPEAAIVSDLGKAKRQQIKKLKRGTGPLLDEVHHVVARVRHELGEEAAGRKLVPVVVLYERRRKKRRGWFGG